MFLMGTSSDKSEFFRLSRETRKSRPIKKCKLEFVCKAHKMSLSKMFPRSNSLLFPSSAKRDASSSSVIYLDLIRTSPLVENTDFEFLGM